MFDTYQGLPVQVVEPGTPIRGTIVDDKTIRLTKKAAYMTPKAYNQLLKERDQHSA